MDILLVIIDIHYYISCDVPATYNCVFLWYYIILKNLLTYDFVFFGLDFNVLQWLACAHAKWVKTALLVVDINVIA